MRPLQSSPDPCMANLRTKILDFRGFDPSIILMLRCGILMSTGNFLEISSQQILVDIILVGRLVVLESGNSGVRTQADASSSGVGLRTLDAGTSPNLLTQHSSGKVAMRCVLCINSDTHLHDTTRRKQTRLS